MKTTPIIPFFLAALLATACGSSDAAHEGHDHDTTAVESPEHDDHAGDEGNAVQLDNGKTWEANIETTDGVNAMLDLVEAYDPASGKGAMLKEELEAEFKEIFAKCTMTGESHEQLHNYLIPIHKTLDKLSPEPSAAELSQLGDYLKTYGNYFH